MKLDNTKYHHKNVHCLCEIKCHLGLRLSFSLKNNRNHKNKQKRQRNARKSKIQSEFITVFMKRISSLKVLKYPSITWWNFKLTSDGYMAVRLKNAHVLLQKQQEKDRKQQQTLQKQLTFFKKRYFVHKY